MTYDDPDLLELARIGAEARARVEGREPPAPSHVSAMLAATRGGRLARPAWCGRCDSTDCLHPDPLTGRLVRYALCPRCTDLDRRERWGERIERARVALPDGAKGAELSAPWLVELVGPLMTQRARAWAASPVDLGDTATWSLVVEGPSEAAKSAMALAVAQYVLARGERAGASEVDAARAAGVRYMRALDLAAAGPQHGLGKGPSPLEREARDASVLVLDDVGAEDADPGRVIARVLHARYDERRQTVVTTGLTRPAYRLRYDDGLVHKTFGGTVLALSAR
jgi:hypothetical protein